MLNRKRNADLEARCSYLAGELERVRAAADPEQLRQQLATERNTNARIHADYSKTRKTLAAAEDQLKEARQRIDRLVGAQGTLELRAVAAETAKTELIYLIAEHLTRQASNDTLRKRAVEVGHGDDLDTMLRLIAAHNTTPAVAS